MNMKIKVFEIFLIDLIVYFLGLCIIKICCKAQTYAIEDYIYIIYSISILGMVLIEGLIIILKERIFMSRGNKRL